MIYHRPSIFHDLNDGKKTTGDQEIHLLFVELKNVLIARDNDDLEFMTRKLITGYKNWGRSQYKQN